MGGQVGTPTDRGKLVPGLRQPGLPPVPVLTPDLPKLPWTLRDGAKEFHLIAMPVTREVLPNLVLNFWGFNGTMPGPMIEVKEGDRVRIIVENRLPEPTSIHWHSLEIPVSQDGVPGLTDGPARTNCNWRATERGGHLGKKCSPPSACTSS